MLVKLLKAVGERPAGEIVWVSDEYTRQWVEDGTAAHVAHEDVVAEIGRLMLEARPLRAEIAANSKEVDRLMRRNGDLNRQLEPIAKRIEGLTKEWWT